MKDSELLQLAGLYDALGELVVQKRIYSHYEDQRILGYDCTIKGEPLSYGEHSDSQQLIDLLRKEIVTSLDVGKSSDDILANLHATAKKYIRDSTHLRHSRAANFFLAAIQTAKNQEYKTTRETRRLTTEGEITLPTKLEHALGAVQRKARLEKESKEREIELKRKMEEREIESKRKMEERKIEHGQLLTEVEDAIEKLRPIADNIHTYKSAGVSHRLRSFFRTDKSTQAAIAFTKMLAHFENFNTSKSRYSIQQQIQYLKYFKNGCDTFDTYLDTPIEDEGIQRTLRDKYGPPPPPPPLSYLEWLASGGDTPPPDDYYYDAAPSPPDGRKKP